MKLTDPDQRVGEAQIGRLSKELKRLGGIRLGVLVAPRQLLRHPVEGVSQG
jgi:hypothetical protein